MVIRPRAWRRPRFSFDSGNNSSGRGERKLRSFPCGTTVVTGSAQAAAAKAAKRVPAMAARTPVKPIARVAVSTRSRMADSSPCRRWSPRGSR